jgi:transposase InsO family protein
VVALRVASDEREHTMLTLFAQALMAHGKCDALYLDNGATYRGAVLQPCCSRLGITLLHAKPYDALARDKLERFWRRMREEALSHLGEVGSLADAVQTWGAARSSRSVSITRAWSTRATNPERWMRARHPTAPSPPVCAPSTTPELRELIKPPAAFRGAVHHNR